MTQREERLDQVLSLVNQFPGLNARQYWLKLGLSESRKAGVHEWLFALRSAGKLRDEEVRVDGHLRERRWWPVQP